MGSYLLYSFTLDKVLILQNYSKHWGLDVSLSSGAELKDLKSVAMNESTLNYYPALFTTQLLKVLVCKWALAASPHAPVELLLQ